MRLCEQQTRSDAIKHSQLSGSSWRRVQGKIEIGLHGIQSRQSLSNDADMTACKRWRAHLQGWQAQ